MQITKELLPDDVKSLTRKLLAFIERHPEGGLERLEIFLNDDKVLIDTAKVADMTDWCIPYINRLCRQGDIPYIPGKPHKFMVGPLMLALRKLQVGGDYGRRKSRTLNRTHKQKAKSIK